MLGQGSDASESAARARASEAGMWRGKHVRCPRQAESKTKGRGNGGTRTHRDNGMLQVYKLGELGQTHAGESVDTNLSGCACGTITVMYYL